MTGDRGDSLNKTENKAALLDLKDFLPFQLRRTYAVVTSQLQQIYEGEFALTTSEWRVLAILVRDGEATNREIGENATIDKVAVSRAISKLADRNFVDRRPHPEDGRSELLYPSQAGMELYQALSMPMLETEQELFGALDGAERKQLENLLRKVEESGRQMIANQAE